jgi:hypothetical protein
VAVEHGEDGTARAAEEGFGEDGGCTHFGVMCTRKGYGGARGFGVAPRIPGAQRRGTWATRLFSGRENLGTDRHLWCKILCRQPFMTIGVAAHFALKPSHQPLDPRQ